MAVQALADAQIGFAEESSYGVRACRPGSTRWCRLT